MVGSLFGTVASQFITSANTSINNKLLEKCLVKQIMQYIPDKCDAKKIALDIIKNCQKKEGNVNWVVRGYKFLTNEELDADGSTRLSGYHKNMNAHSIRARTDTETENDDDEYHSAGGRRYRPAGRADGAVCPGRI